MNGKDYRRGHYAGSLRIYLFSEHLGLTDRDSGIDISDPICDDFFIKTWQTIAYKNTKIFDDVSVNRKPIFPHWRPCKG